MAFQMGFPKKLNVPQRKIQNKSFGDINIKPRKGRMGIDEADYSNELGVGKMITKVVGGIRQKSPDIHLDC